MSVGQEFLIVATGISGGNEKEQLFAQLRSQKELSGQGEGPWQFEVPDGDRSLLFGSFDALIRLTDELQKTDAQFESTVRRLERQYLEFDAHAEFKIINQRQERQFMDYFTRWQWDQAKNPKTRSIEDTAAALSAAVTRVDEETRKKTAEYNDAKSQRGSVAKKEGANTLPTVDLVDVLTPKVVICNGNEHDDFIYTNCLTTVAVVLPRGTERDFLAVYESLTPTVIPKSAKCFKNLTDKDGNQLWRVVLCHRFEEDTKQDKATDHIGNFKRECRSRRFVPRDFEYSEEGYKALLQKRERMNKEVGRQQEMVKVMYKNTWSDVMVALLHVKAMRIFVESVLRFGMPPRFAAFIVTPKPSAMPAARRALANILGKGRSVLACIDQGEDDEEFFPYVSVTFVPFTAARS